jgi:hypothetical protein
MSHQHDPNPIDRPTPTTRPAYSSGGGAAPLVAVALAAALVIALIAALWPSGETAPRVTENAPRPEQTTKPPAPTPLPAVKPDPAPVPTPPPANNPPPTPPAQ